MNVYYLVLILTNLNLINGASLFCDITNTNTGTPMFYFNIILFYFIITYINYIKIHLSFQDFQMNSKQK